MEPEVSTPHSQLTATCPYHEPDQPSPCPHPTSWRSILMLFSHLCLGFPIGSFPQISPNKILVDTQIVCRKFVAGTGIICGFPKGKINHEFERNLHLCMHKLLYFIFSTFGTSNANSNTLKSTIISFFLMHW